MCGHSVLMTWLNHTSCTHEHVGQGVLVHATFAFTVLLHIASALIALHRAVLGSFGARLTRKGRRPKNSPSGSLAYGPIRP